MAGLLKAFVQANQGEPGTITPNQRRELKALASQHGREKFRAAGMAWLKEGKWNSKTTHPFVAFIGGFEGYAAKAPYEQARKAKGAASAMDAERTTEFWHRKALVGHGEPHIVNKDFLDSLLQEDRDYVAKVREANCLEEMPPNNGRSYIGEALKFIKEREAEAQVTFDEAVEDGNF